MRKQSLIFVQPEQQLSNECFSLSVRRRINTMFSLVASAGCISARGPCWTLGIVAEDKSIGLESIITYNYKVSSTGKLHFLVETLFWAEDEAMRSPSPSSEAKDGDYQRWKTGNR